MESLYTAFYMMDDLETGHVKVFATSPQEAADKVRARADVLEVFSVCLPVTNWK